jgi:hypothetical protein
MTAFLPGNAWPRTRSALTMWVGIAILALGVVVYLYLTS